MSRVSGRVERIRHGVRQARTSAVARGGAVTLLGLVSYTALQLLSVPVLAHAFGLEGYGIWLLLWSMPAYFVLADLGLSNAAGNEIAAKWGAGDREGMDRTFQSISIVNAGAAAAIVLLTILFVAATSAIDGFWSEQLASHRFTMVALALWAAIVLLCQPSAVALRGAGHYVRSSLLVDGASSTDSIVLLAAAALSGDINISAAAMLGSRIVGTGVIIWQTQLHCSVRLGTRHASLAEVRRLLPSALGSLAIPTALAISLQGSLLLIGSAFGPVAVALIVPARTVSRTGLQLISVINRATIPSLAAAHGRADRDAQLRLWRWSRGLTATLLLLGSAAFALLGPEIVWLWTGGLVDTPRLYVVILAASLVLNGWWYYSLWLLTATHAHTRRTPYLLGGTALGLLVGVALMPVWGVPGVLAGVLVGDLILALLIEGAVRGELRSLRAAPA